MIAPHITTFPGAVVPMLTGTLPVRPINPDGFVGTMEQDGQSVKVAAIAFDAHWIALMSLVGRDTSVSAVLAQIWKNKEAVFRPAEEVAWKEREQGCKRLSENYKQFATQLTAFKLTHAIAIPLGAHIAEGVLQAPHMGKHPHLKDVRIPESPPRYVLGNLAEMTPHPLSFLGHLRALRVVLLYRDEAHPERLLTWANELWQRGSQRELIVPLPSLGVRMWKIQPDVYQWNALVAQGVAEGWLPWQ